jgi:hypothetical protein
MSQSLKIWRESQKKPLIFHSKKYGNIRLHSFLRMGDLEVLANYLSDDEIDAKEFTVKVLTNVALASPRSDIQGWDDKTLILMAEKWAKAALPEDVDKVGVKGFEDFKSTISRFMNRILNAMGESMKKMGNVIENLRTALAATVAKQMEKFTSQFALVLSELTKTFSEKLLVQSVLSQILPEMQKIISSVLASAKNADEIKEILELSEYELAPIIIHSQDLLDLKGKNFEPTLTNKLFNRTKTNEFIAEVESIFASPRLKKRMPVLKQALIAHQSHQFYLSTPVFISQTDGIFTDWLIFLKLVRRKKGIVVACEKEEIRKNKQLLSLRARVKHAKENINTNGLLKTAIDNVLTRSIGERNAILHGEKNNYGTAKYSTQALLMVLFFASVLESAIKDTKKYNSK